MSGVFFNSILTFQSHKDNYCKKVSHKLNAISRKTPYMDFSKRKFIGNAFFFHHNLTTVRWFGCTIAYILKLLQRFCKKTHIKGQRHYFLRNQRDFVISTIKSVKYDWKALGFLDQIYGTAFKKNWKIKSQLTVLKWLLKNGKQNHVLVVSVKHTCRT